MITIRPLRLLQRAEQLLIIFALLLFSRAFAPLFENSATAGPFAQQLIYLAVFGMIALLILVRLGRFAFVALSDNLTPLLIGLVALSAIWSVAPLETLGNLPIFLGATALGIYLAARFRLEEQIQLLAAMLVIAALLSLFFGLFLDVGITRVGSNAGSWQGIYGHKNDLGRYMALLIVLLWLVAPRRWLSWGIMALAALLILLSESATSILALGGMILVIMLYRTLQWRDTRAVPLLVAAGVFLLSLLLIVVLANSAWVLDQLGKDLTFTGRTALWGDVWTKIMERPWLGFGYNAFWLGPQSEAADIWRIHGWRPNHAHNGFLDLWLELGLAGLLLVLLHVLLNTRRAFRWAIVSKSAVSLWPLVYITLLFMYNFNYSVLVSQSVFFWIIYLAAVYRTRLELRRYALSALPAVPSPSLPTHTVPQPF